MKSATLAERRYSSIIRRRYCRLDKCDRKRE